MTIICQCNVITRNDFKKAVAEQESAANAALPVRKAAGMILLVERSNSETRSCLGNCHSCLPEIREMVEKYRNNQAANALPSPVQEREPA